VWEGIQPEHTLMIEGDVDELGEIQPDLVRRIIQDSVRIQDYTMRALTDTEQRA
jgi:hypothetical protein